MTDESTQAIKPVSLAEFEEMSGQLIAHGQQGRSSVYVCCGTGCSAQGARKVLAELRDKLPENTTVARRDCVMTGCHGFCEAGPLVVVRKVNEGGSEKRDIFYHHVKVEDVPDIITETIEKNGTVERLLFQDPASGHRIVEEQEIPFYKHQTRLLLAQNGRIDPTKIEDFIATGGYRALAKAVQMEPESIIKSISAAGLRGRGGAGFPTGLKWAACRSAIEKQTEVPNAYVVCNADEGDPGAFMDRSILEGNPHSVIEGMIIGARAIAGGMECESKGYIYVRAEYPLAVSHLKQALSAARAYGLLGENILGTGMNFDIEVVQGAGAFVCGEETALLESIEDKPGEPRPKPPYPVISGLWGWPTLMNNVKTWAFSRYIIENGHEAFSAIGTKDSKGTMVFALVGKIRNSGLIEVPMGIELRKIVEDIGNGVPGGGQAKAVQTGGPSGGCLPASMFDMCVDYASLAEAGTIMGSGGMIVMDEKTCMVDTARYFLHFAMEESCGKCTPCREGVRHLHDILEEICAGRGKSEHLEMLESAGRLVGQLSFCGLGKTAPNPIISTLRYFREEYEAHLAGRCPAKVCTALIKYTILEDTCTGCTACAHKCPVGCISGERKKLHVIDQSRCVKCGICMQTCKFSAIEVN